MVLQARRQAYVAAMRWTWAMYRWLINTRAWDFFPKERFDQINDLHTHAAWDFVNKNSVRGAGIGGRTRHRCQICSAVGAIWHGEYRGGTLEPRRALVMCSGPRCPRAYCSLACYNLWHRNQEMPDTGAAAAGESRR